MRGAWSVPAAVLVLVGCGRIGFESAAPPGGGSGGSGGDAITVIVTSRAGLSPAGEPVAGASVLIDRGAAFERTTTDDTGAARFPADGVLAYHVVHETDEQTVRWQVYTVAAPRPGITRLGDPPPITRRRMTFSVPPGSPGDSFYVRLPDSCGAIAPAASPIFTVDYNVACDGRSVHVVAFRSGSAGDAYVDAGSVVIADGASHVVTGSYQPLESRAIEIINLPMSISTALVRLFELSGADLVRLSPNTPVLEPVLFPSATLMTRAAPGANALQVELTHEASLGFVSTTTQLAPATIAATTRFDASVMLPMFTSVALDGTTATWAGGEALGTAITVEGTAGTLRWNAFAEPSAVELTYPVLPADLATPRIDAFVSVVVTRLGAPGSSVRTTHIPGL